MNSSFKVKIGINPISWCNDDLPSLGAEVMLETILSEGARIGYQGFELGNKFPREATALAQVLKAHQVACISGWYSGYLAEGSVEAEIARVAPHLHLLRTNGCQVMVYGEVASAIQGQPQPLYKRPRFQQLAQWQAYGERLNAFALHLQQQGITLAYHHHMGAYVESAADIDQLMAVTGPQVGLLFDTGHITFAGGDVQAVLRRHIARVVHVHCKDVRPAVLQQARNGSWHFLQAVLNGAFTVPGDGSLDFAAILRTLAQHDYQGWLVVEAEQDPVVAPSYHYAELGYRTLSGIVQQINQELSK